MHVLALLLLPYACKELAELISQVTTPHGKDSQHKILQRLSAVHARE